MTHLMISTVEYLSGQFHYFPTVARRRIEHFSKFRYFSAYPFVKTYPEKSRLIYDRKINFIAVSRIDFH